MVATLLVVGSASVADATNSADYSQSLEDAKAECDEYGGTWVEYDGEEADVGTCGVKEYDIIFTCIDNTDPPLTLNCTIYDNSAREKPGKELRQIWLDFGIRGRPADAKKVPKRTQKLLDAFMVIARPGYLEKLSPRTRLLLEALTIVLLQGDELGLCGISDQPVPQRGGGAPDKSPSTTAPSTTLPPETTTSSGPFLQ